MCDNCEPTHIYQWLGIYWYGNPWPFRLRVRRWRIVVDPQPGCGCVKLLKDMANTWRMHRLSVKHL